MNKERIDQLLKNPLQSTHQDLYDLEKMAEKYPYCQFIHILISKISKHLNTDNSENKLHRAAIYSTDRTILKSVITEPFLRGGIENPRIFQNDLEGVDIHTKIHEQGEIPEIPSVQEEVPEEPSDQPVTSEQLFEEVLKNLEKLRELRKQYDFIDKQIEEENAPKKEKTTDKKTEKKEKKPKTTKKEEQLKEILDKDEVIDSEVNTFLLDQIQKKEEDKSDTIDQKTRTQRDIIDDFIKEDPGSENLRSANSKSPEDEIKDLSIMSTQFNDDLVSENLAVIFLKQGKKERAVDIYKKLIWKFPQKKAYFAAQIEKIKN